MVRRSWVNRTVLALGMVLLLPGVAQSQVPGNIGNLDDGATVDVNDLVGVREFDPSWIPSPTDVIGADCAATADPAFIREQNGIKLIRGWGHWDCNMSLPGNYLETCLDAVFPSVSCNDKFRARPTSSLSVPVDFPCIPGVYITMAAGYNLFDTNPSNDVDHAQHALIVLPQDCL